MTFFDTVNGKVEASIVGRYFKLKERRTSFLVELRAGAVTFLTMAYILAVNAGIVKDTGGPCLTKYCSPPPTGPFPGVPNHPHIAYCPQPTTPEDAACAFGSCALDNCLLEFKKNIITATAASALISTFLMGALANMPIGLAAGMGVNAYFTYNVVGFMGTGTVTYQTALAAVFIEGWIFIALAITGMRTKMIGLVPRTLILAMSVGIGLFLAHIGLQGSEGIGVVAYEPATLVTLGGCSPDQRSHQYTPLSVETADMCTVVNGTVTLNLNNLGPPSPNYSCSTRKMRSPTMWLGIAGGFIIAVALKYNVKGAMMLGILFVTFISWIPNTEVSYLKGSPIPGGQERWNYFKNVVDTPSLALTGAVFTFNLGKADVWVALITLLYVDFFDCTGTLYTMANFVGKYVPNFMNVEDKTFPGQLWAFCADGFGIVCGALMGVPPVTAYIESASGIREGGRTGLTAITTAFLFFISLFFAPLLASIPGYATGPALIIVGALMMFNVLYIDWDDLQEAIPAFATIAVMPLTYSIAYGVIAGLGTYIGIFLICLVINSILKYGFGIDYQFAKTEHVEEFETHDNPIKGPGKAGEVELSPDSTPSV